MILFGLVGAAILALIAAAIYLFVVLPAKGVIAFSAWSERKHLKEEERRRYALPKILGGELLASLIRCSLSLCPKIQTGYGD